MVNPRALFRILENGVIEQSQLGTQVLESNVGFRQMISAHLGFVLVLGINVVGRSHFIVNGGSEVHGTLSTHGLDD